MTTHYSFQRVIQSRSVRTFCPQCKKKRSVKISRQYFRNGFHDEAATRRQHDIEIAEESRKTESEGLICSLCQQINDGIPELRKVSPDEYAAYSRKTGKLLGRIHRVKDDRTANRYQKWIVHKPKRDYSSNVRDAAIFLRDSIEG